MELDYITVFLLVPVAKGLKKH